MKGYITCACGERVEYDEGKYFCKKCNKYIKPEPSKGWSCCFDEELDTIK